MTEFLLTGNGPLTNRGCEAIVLATRDLLEQEFGSVRLLLASFAHDKQAHVPAGTVPLALNHERPRWSRAWWQYQFDRALRRPENKGSFLSPLQHELARPGRAQQIVAALSIGGDGYAIDYGHFSVDRLMIMDRFLKSLGIPVIVWGASVGPFTQEPEFEQAVARHLATLNLVVVREPQSFEYLKGLGLRENLVMAPDPAFVLAPEAVKLPDDAEEILARGCIGLNLSPLLARYVAGGDYQRWVDLAAQLVTELLKIKPVLMIHHVTAERMTGEPEPGIDDHLLLSRVRTRLPPAVRDRVALLPRGLGCRNLAWVIGRTRVFIGARMHSTIAALVAGVPTISLAYSRKAWGVNELVFGHHDWVVGPESFNPPQLRQLVRRALKRYDTLNSFLRCRVAVLALGVRDAVREVRRIVQARRAESEKERTALAAEPEATKSRDNASQLVVGTAGSQAAWF
ncbi:MAG: polysaccharide pyruvyl transferase family protein [candidate division WOR-3 bacterium]